ncbi:MAG: hypothetical protein HOV80_15535 [Polyangiaceae bacterium]|nr:hypothetical protein [Polyangiaceae bacterium]
MTVSLSLLVLRCSDIEASKRFYEALGLSFRAEQHENGPAHWSTQVGGVLVELYPAQQKLLSVGRLGFEVENLQRVLQLLAAVGAKVLEASAAGDRAVVVDPDGARVELTQIVADLLPALAEPSVFTRIAEQRRYGQVTTAILQNKSGFSARALADVAARVNGFRALGSEWRQIDQADALAISFNVLHRDLAYGASMMTRQAAEQLAREVLTLIPEPVAYFTNGTWAEGFAAEATSPYGAISWKPISDATFDAGIIAVGAEKTVLLWVQDED